MTLFNFELLLPERLLYKGPVTLVIAPGQEGELGILAYHIPFLTCLSKGIVRIFVYDEPEINFLISGGHLEMINNQCTILGTEDVS